MKKFLVMLIASMFLLMSCTSDSSDDNNSGTGPTPDGVTSATVDASSYDAWVYYSFDKKAEVTVENPENSTEWDVAFQRMKIRVNGGTSGKGGLSVTDLGEVDFDGVEDAPSKYYTFDDMIYFQMNPTEPYSANKIVEHWYNMAGMPPVLTSKGHVYVIKRADDYVKFEVTNYYNPTTQASGNMSFRFKTGLEMSNDVNIKIIERTFDVSDYEEWVYYSLSEDKVVELDTIPEADYNWDLAFRRYQVKTNSGTSGPNSNSMMDNESSKGFGAIDLGEVDFEETRVAPEEGYIVDSMLIPPMGGAEFSASSVFENWYNMYGMPPVFESKNHVYMVKYESGRYVKMQITAYQDPSEKGPKEFKIRYEKCLSTKGE